MNRVDLIGHLGQDPEITVMSNGDKVLKMSIATSEHWKDKQTGERRSQTEWSRIVCFNQHLVSLAERFIKKGSKIRVCGKMKTRKWTDDAGVDKYVTEVVMSGYGGEIELLDKKDDSPQQENTTQQAEPKAEPARTETVDTGEFCEDSIPF